MARIAGVRRGPGLSGAPAGASNRSSRASALSPSAPDASGWASLLASDPVWSDPVWGDPVHSAPRSTAPGAKRSGGAAGSSVRRGAPALGGLGVASSGETDGPGGALGSLGSVGSTSPRGGARGLSLGVGGRAADSPGRAEGAGGVMTSNSIGGFSRLGCGGRAGIRSQARACKPSETMSARTVIGGRGESVSRCRARFCRLFFNTHPKGTTAVAVPYNPPHGISVRSAQWARHREFRRTYAASPLPTYGEHPRCLDIDCSAAQACVFPRSVWVR